MYPLKGPTLVAFLFFSFVLALLIVALTFSYVMTKALPLWMIGLLPVSLVLLGLLNYSQDILRSSVDLNQFEVRFEANNMNPFANTPAIRILFFLLFISIMVQISPSPLASILVIGSIILAPAWLLILSLENQFSKIFELKLWFKVIKTLGRYYWLLLTILSVVSYSVHHFLLVEGGFFGFIFSIYLILFYHRIVGLLLRNNESSIALPEQWSLTENAKSKLIHNAEILKFQHLIQNMRKTTSDEIFAEKLQLIMARKNYDGAKSLLEALMLMETNVHAFNFCRHYITYLIQSKEREQLQNVINFCLKYDDEFLLEKDIQNVLLAMILFDFNKELTIKICNNFIRNRKSSNVLDKIIKLKNKAENNSKIKN